MATTNESWCGCIQPEHFHTQTLVKNAIKRVKQDQNPTAGMDDQPNVDPIPEIAAKRGICSVTHPPVKALPVPLQDSEMVNLPDYFVMGGDLLH